MENLAERRTLLSTRDRAEGVFPCEVCGQSVGVLAAANALGIRETLAFLSTYVPRRASVGRYQRKGHDTDFASACRYIERNNASYGESAPRKVRRQK